jgi:hypothetical protein
MPGLDPGIHLKCERSGESPAFLFYHQILSRFATYYLLLLVEK